MCSTCLTAMLRRIILVIVASCSLLTGFGAGAVSTENLFEIDGNVADSALALPDDWASFYPNNNSNTTRATGIVPDSAPAVFRNGSKDTLDISTWKYDLGSSPPKDDMLNAYAAAYTVPATNTTTGGDLIIYFGADRVSFNGTASLGFWFFKNPVARNDATGTFVVPGTNTPAQHADGDVLIAFEYTNGGAVTSARKFVWRGNGTSGSLVDLGVIGQNATNVPSVYCDPADTVCTSTNSAPILLPWNGTIQAGQLFEGGINITKAVGGDSCFAGFMATSRSASTANASIKNFVLAPSFPVCSVAITKQCVEPALQSGGTAIKYTVQGKVLNDGGGQLTNIVLTDNPALDANSLQFYQCDANGLPTGTGSTSPPATLAANASICYKGFITTNLNGASDTMTVSASTGTGTVSKSANATCPVVNAAPGLSVSKICDVDLVASNNTLAVKINYSGTVTNTGDVALSNVKVCETHELTIPAGTSPCDVPGNIPINIGNLAAGAATSYSGTYFPTQALNGSGVSTLTSPQDAIFKDQVAARGTTPAIFGAGTVNSLPVEASCPLCPPH